MLNLAVFASGQGTNCAAIHQAITENKLKAKIALIVSNQADAGVLDFAKKNTIPYCHISSENFSSKDKFYEELFLELDTYKVEFIVLAGYMKKIGTPIIRKYPNKILNIHPALLPSFGGKGMYGLHVHEAVINYGAKISGITIHLVDEEYDHGAIVMQKCVEVFSNDTAGSLGKRIQQMEYDTYWQAIQLFAENRVVINNRKIIIQ
ncbi:phosphoribosylglycinamide formyltransferase [bacterium]|nr:phosphoribosylglycinamide formyltransferase [bacterium]